MSNTNPGYAFPLEKLGSDIARNQFNYESIFNGLIEWNTTDKDNVVIRLTMATDPYYYDYVIPSKTSMKNNSSNECDVKGIVSSNKFYTDCFINKLVYGGTQNIITTSVDASQFTSLPTSYMEIGDISGFSINSEIKFIKSTSTDILPTPLVENILYTIETITGNIITLRDSSNSIVTITGNGDGIIQILKKDILPNPMIINQGELVYIKNLVKNNGNVKWDIYYSHVFSNWMSGIEYKWGSIVLHDNNVYKAVFNVTSSSSPTIDITNWISLYKTWVSGNMYKLGDYVIYNDALYEVIDENILINAGGSFTNPSITQNVYKLLIPAWVANVNYGKGTYLMYNNIPYITYSDIAKTSTIPSDDSRWLVKILNRVPSVIEFNSSSIYQWSATYDVDGFYYRNISITDSDDLTDINLYINTRINQPASIYEKSVDVISTSNVSYWPYDNTRIWNSGNIYGPTDTTRNFNDRQDYSSIMVFDHTRKDIVKTVNFINYDGPDLDRGLCIYLPVEVNVGEDGVAYPEDGFTYEYFFRIWPDVTYTNAVTRDHIINKAQIYVYSVLNAENVKDNTCASPIAKFSMARTTNFHVFNENISIPDKPVCYRASFIYDASMKRWNVLDYYQLPDHIFMGPIGYIDPQNPSNADINEMINGFNNNPQFVGYETAAFPLFQDPFSDSNLSPYVASDINEFSNRIIE